MITLRRSADRGAADYGWLKTRYSFSFADYHDPAHMGFRSLRVINEDRISAGGGFPAHPHRNMEIITYVVKGALAHKDSLGSGAAVSRGEVQRMTAGRGIQHSEFNPSSDEELHLLQIWVIPDHTQLSPEYEQKSFDIGVPGKGPVLLASPDGERDSLRIHQDVKLYALTLAEKEQTALDLEQGRAAWVQVVEGAVLINGYQLQSGDGAQIENEPKLTVSGEQRSELLLFDLGPESED